MKVADAYKLVRGIVRVLRDSSRTDEILRVADMTGRRRYAALLAELGHRDDMVRLLRDRPEITNDTVDFAALRALPANTLGGAYARHLHEHGLDVEALNASPVFIEDPQAAYLIRRVRQNHDIWHPLLGLGTRGHEEVLVHAFTWGQLKLPASAMILFFGAIKHMVLERRWASLRYGMLDAYRIGRDADALLCVVWEQHWGEPIDAVRRRYRVRVVEPAFR